MRPEKQADTEFEDYVITRVEDQGESWALSSDTGTLNVEKVPGIEPKVGSRIRYYGKGLGYPVRGVDVDGQELYYRTDAEQREQHRKWADDQKREKQEKAAAEAGETARRIAALPEVFQRRIQKFRDNNKDFDWEYLPYELHCCEEAVKFANAVKREMDRTGDDSEGAAIELLTKIRDGKAPFKDLPAEGHSGNTMGFSLRLARHYLVDPELVVLEHGALSNLVGCDAYGCPHPNQEIPDEPSTLDTAPPGPELEKVPLPDGGPQPIAF